jgi:hypothetical protein
VRRREALRVAALVHGVLRLAARRRVRVNDQIDVCVACTSHFADLKRLFFVLTFTNKNGAKFFSFTMSNN